MNDMASELIKSRMRRTGESADRAAKVIAAKCTGESSRKLVEVGARMKAGAGK